LNSENTDNMPNGILPDGVEVFLERLWLVLDGLDAIGEAAVCALNALPRQQQLGMSGGCNYVRSGHIKGSVNIPSDDFLLRAYEVRQRFEGSKPSIGG
jgi:hypothetical protein